MMIENNTLPLNSLPFSLKTMLIFLIAFFITARYIVWLLEKASDPEEDQNFDTRVGNLLGVFTGNKYKIIDGAVWVKHPLGDWEKLSEHTKKYHRKRDDFR